MPLLVVIARKAARKDSIVAHVLFSSLLQWKGLSSCKGTSNGEQIEEELCGITHTISKQRCLFQFNYIFPGHSRTMDNLHSGSGNYCKVSCLLCTVRSTCPRYKGGNVRGVIMTYMVSRSVKIGNVFVFKRYETI